MLASGGVGRKMPGCVTAQPRDFGATVTFVHTVDAGSSGSICGLFWTPPTPLDLDARVVSCRAADTARGNSFQSGAEIDRTTHQGGATWEGAFLAAILVSD